MCKATLVNTIRQPHKMVIKGLHKLWLDSQNGMLYNFNTKKYAFMYCKEKVLKRIAKLNKQGMGSVLSFM